MGQRTANRLVVEVSTKARALLFLSLPSRLLTPQPVIDPFFIPRICRLEIAGQIRVDVCFDGVFIQVNAEAGGVGHADIAVLDDGIGKPVTSVFHGG